MILAAKRPLIMIGAGGNRPRLVEALSSFVRRTRLPFFNTQMGKGAVTGGSNLYMGTAALFRARLRPPGDRPGRPHHLDRPRHHREAALHHGRGRARR